MTMISKLINSEFDEGENTRDLKKYLFEFKKQYRKKENQKVLFERSLHLKENEVESLKKDNDNLKKENEILKKKYKKLKSKKLSFKERLSGKIKN
jgi:predicted RNase H-like nuclease (RuvC/YqgF family)